MTPVSPSLKAEPYGSESFPLEQGFIKLFKYKEKGNS